MPGGIASAQDALLAKLKAEREAVRHPGGGRTRSARSATCAARRDPRAPTRFGMSRGSGSGGTHAGLLAGLRAAGAPAVPGTSCLRGREAHARILPLARACAPSAVVRARRRRGRRGRARGRLVADDDVIIHDAYVGPLLEVHARVAELPARPRGTRILLDPVYTGKGAAGLLDLCRKGAFAPGSKVLFLHTGARRPLPLQAPRAVSERRAPTCGADRPNDTHRRRGNASGGVSFPLTECRG